MQGWPTFYFHAPIFLAINSDVPHKQLDILFSKEKGNDIFFLEITAEMAKTLRLSLDSARNDADLWEEGVYLHVAQFGKCLAFFAA